MVKIILSLAIGLLCACSTPSAPLAQESSCRVAQRDDGSSVVIHAVTEESFFLDGSCPCGLDAQTAPVQTRSN